MSFVIFDVLHCANRLRETMVTQYVRYARDGCLLAADSFAWSAPVGPGCDGIRALAVAVESRL